MGLAVLLSLCSAVAYGLSDFLGGLLAKRVSVWAVAATSQSAAAVLTASLVTTFATEASPAAIWWGILGGLGSGAGNVFIYRGLAGGRMAVVAPLSAIASAALPVMVGLATGERPGFVPIAGVLVALPAIWLVSGGGSTSGVAARADVINGTIAGLGFGVQFSALGQVPQEAGLVPLAISQVVSVAAIVAGALVVSAPWVPRTRVGVYAIGAGVLAGAATVFFQLAVQYGMLTISGVLASLYPAVTVILAATMLRERIHVAQGIGLTLAAAAIALIAAG